MVLGVLYRHHEKHRCSNADMEEDHESTWGCDGGCITVTTVHMICCEMEMQTLVTADEMR
jgi:hypothetical protein